MAPTTSSSSARSRTSIPMGVHTGDSITVAPAMTLTDREYQVMRDASIRIIREIGRGGRRLQHPVRRRPGHRRAARHRDESARVALVGARLQGDRVPDRAHRRPRSRSATGSTSCPTTSRETTPASFEPVLDYVVVKIPRFAFEKFPAADPTLTTQMKSVGEAMAIGRTFKEALQKGLRGLETDRAGWVIGATAGRRPAARRRAWHGALAALRTPDAGADLPGQARAAGRRHGRGHRGAHRHRSVVPRTDGGAARGRARLGDAGPDGQRRGRARHAAADEAAGLLRPPACRRCAMLTEEPIRAAIATGSASGRPTRRWTPAPASFPPRTPYLYSSLRRGERGSAPSATAPS